MRIAFLDSWFQSSAEGSGTAVAIGGLQRALQQQGIEVTRLAPAGVRPQNLLLRRFLFNLQLPAQLRRARYDLVLGHDIDGFLWSRQASSPYLVSVKGVLAEEARQEQGSIRRMLWSLSRLERYNTRQAQGVLTTSAYCRDAIRRHYGVPETAIRLVPEGIDLEYWQQIAASTPHSSNGATILCVARQYPRKHVATLIQAMAHVHKAIPHAQAIIIGDGPEHDSLRELVQKLQLGNHVRLTGAIPDDREVARAYRQADIFCLPSVQEGFGIVFLEAMASGLPIISTTAAAIPEIVPDGQAGMLVPPGDTQALAETLIELLKNPQRRAQLGSFGRTHVARYDWKQVAQLFLEQVEPYLKRPAPVTVEMRPYS